MNKGQRPSQSPQKAEERDPLPGMVVNGKYRVSGVLARGGMGKIYNAEQVPLGRPVALKVLRTRYADELADDPQFHKRFFLEASILAKLQHTNIVTLYDYGRIEGVDGEQYFMAMELLRGDTLSKRLRTHGAIHPADALRIVRQIARGLLAAHRLGVVHRDLKPSNVMLLPEEDGGEVVKILDFGIGKVIASDSEDLTAEGAFVGSPRYMAPEQIHDGKVDPRTDIYALGVIMYECFCGRVPFEGETNIATMMSHCNQPAPPMRERVPGAVVPERIERMVMHCLSKSPDARPQSMEELGRELAACEAELSGTSTVTLSSPRAAYWSSGSLPNVNASALGEAPTVQGLTPIPGSHGSGSHGSGVARPSSPTGQGASSGTGTHRSLVRSWMPPASQPPGAKASGKAGLWVVLGVAAVAAVAIGVTLAVVRAPKDPPPQAANATERVSATRAAFMLSVDSNPPGAQIVDGDGITVVGVTPAQLPVDQDSLRAGPRRFTVKLDGYAPYTFTQGASEADVRVIAQLVALPDSAPLASSDSTASAAPKPPPVAIRVPPRAPDPPKTASPPARTDLDIKLKR